MNATSEVTAQQLLSFFTQADANWQGDATSVIEFLRPLREQLDATGVLEVRRTLGRNRARLEAGGGP
jgi:hypothetical protein